MIDLNQIGRMIITGVVIFGVIGIIVAIILKVFHNFFVKHKVMRNLIVCVYISSIFIALLLMVNQYSDVYSTKKEFYVYGKVEIVNNSFRRLTIDSVRTNFKEGGKGRLTILLNKDTEIKDAKAKTLNFSNIHEGDIVQVVCQESELKDGNTQVNAIRITIAL